MATRLQLGLAWREGRAEDGHARAKATASGVGALTRVIGSSHLKRYPPPPEEYGWSRMKITWRRADLTIIAERAGWARWLWTAPSDHWEQIFIQDP